jgi:hypothetical protein
MRPLHVLSLLAVLAALLVGVLFFLGRGESAPAREVASGPTPAVREVPGARAGIETARARRHRRRPESTRAASLATPAALASSPTPKKASPTATITGRVVGNLGKPIEGATVYAADRNEILTIPLDEIDPSGMRGSAASRRRRTRTAASASGPTRAR